MKVTCCVASALLLSACATPQPIVDTAAKVTKMTNDMEHSVSNYVKSLKTARQSDAERLQGLRADAETNTSSLRQQIQIMTLANEAGSLKLLNTLAVAPDPDPLRTVAATSKDSPAAISFDSAPLKAVAQVTAEIAQPRSVGEQVDVLFEFSKTVNGDLEKAAKNSEKPAKP